MKIEEGKYYRTREGNKVGPISRVRGGEGDYYWSDGVSLFGQFTNKWSIKGYSSSYPGLDIISEWKDETPSPIRTITRKEIVQGNYGIVAITKSNKVMIAAGNYTADQLHEAAHTLNQIAEALEDD